MSDEKQTTPAVEEPKKVDSTEEAKRVLMEEQKTREDVCAKEISDVLEKHNCELQVGMMVTSTGNRPILKVSTKIQQ